MVALIKPDLIEYRLKVIAIRKGKRVVINFKGIGLHKFLERIRAILDNRRPHHGRGVIEPIEFPSHRLREVAPHQIIGERHFPVFDVSVEVRIQ